MKVKIFFDEPKVLEKEFNEWAEKITRTTNNIYKIETLAFPAYSQHTADIMTIVVYYW